MVDHYERLLRKNVCSIPHGFFEAGFEKTAYDQKLIVVGSITTWGEMRHLEDLIGLYDSIKLLCPKESNLKILAYAGGKFDKRVNFDTC